MFTPRVRETSRPLEPTNEDKFVVMDRLLNDAEMKDKAMMPGLASKDPQKPTKRLL